MQNPWSVLVFTILLALPGCKIEITVPEGGTVDTASGAFTCVAGDTCVIDVGDTSFEETFTAKPDESYFFSQWRRKPRAFCGGNSAPCRLSTSGYEGYDALLSLLESDERFFLEPIFERNPPFEYELTSNVPYAQAATAGASDYALNIYSPLSNGPRPVVVFIHGGGASKDTPNEVTVAQQLAKAGLVAVAVTIQPRTSFIAVDGNGPLVRESIEDVQCALRFVAEHVEAYGGDKARIAVLGHSSGGLYGMLAVLGGDGLDDALRQFELSLSASRQVNCTSAVDLPVVRRFVGYGPALFVYSDPRSPFLPQEALLASLLNPREYVDDVAAHLRVLIVQAVNDAGTPQWHRDEVKLFAQELAEAGHDSATTPVTTLDGTHGWELSGPLWDAVLNALNYVTRN